MVWADRVLALGVVLGFGVGTIFAHQCDDHNFFVRTPICTFLDSMKRSLSLEFNHILVNGIWYSKFRVIPDLFKELCGLLWALFMP